MKIDFKAVYQCRPAHDAIFRAKQKVREAQATVDRAEKGYREEVSKATGIPEKQLLFSDESCMADGIANHVFHIKNCSSPYGHHENLCVFCGCDNQRDL